MEKNSLLVSDNSDNVSSSDDTKNGNDFNYSLYNTQQILSRFGGNVKEEDVVQVDLSERFDQKVEPKTKKLIIPFYFIIMLGSIVMIITGIIGNDIVSGLISLFTIFAMTYIGVIMGAFGTYWWGCVSEAIDDFREENTKYDSQLKDLSKIRESLHDETKNVFFEVGKLNRTTKDLDANLHQFDQLKDQLQDICGQNNDLNDMLKHVTNQYQDMVNLISNNERASLLSIYYETSTKDRKDGLSKDEYQRFLGRLNDKTKLYFTSQGTFDVLAGDDSVIDIREFEMILEKVIKQQENDCLKDIVNI